MMRLAWETRLRLSGTSANAPVSSPSMMLSTIRHGPIASAISALGASAPTLMPRHDADAVCSASVVRNHPRPSRRRPTSGAITDPNTTGKIASTGVSTRSLEKKYGPGAYPPRVRLISRRTVARSRGKPFRLRQMASMLVLIAACIITAARRLI